jgi:hypothetical protein
LTKLSKLGDPLEKLNNHSPYAKNLSKNLVLTFAMLTTYSS